jgi:hypothetical protein
MNVLFHDIIPYSNAPDELKHPQLTYILDNQPVTFEWLDGGLADAIYDLLDGENAASPDNGPADGGMATASFDEVIEGGFALYIDDEYDGGYAADYYDETWDGGRALNTKEFEIKLEKPSAINCFGTGNTDSSAVGMYLIDTNNNAYYEVRPFNRNGLYMLEREYKNIKQINLMFSG